MRGDRRRSVIVRALLVLNVLAYLWLVLTGGLRDTQSLIDHGALYGPAVDAGAWWRILSGAFLHAGFMHLAFNMIALAQVGGIVEGLAGSRRAASIYAFALIGSSCAVLWLNHDVPTIGASGAIFGLFGALVAFGLRLGKSGRMLIRQTLPIIIINMLLGFFVIAGVSNVAHIGGLVCGFIAGIALFPTRRVGLRGTAATLAVDALPGVSSER